MMTLTQLRAMVCYELRRHWRRRGLPLITVLWLLVVVAANHYFGGPDFFGELPDRLLASAHFQRMHHTISLAISSAGASIVFVVLSLGVLAAEVVSLDREQGAGEWQQALPLRYGTYLAGKLSGVWAAATVALLAVMIVSALAARLLRGPFDLSLYLHVWLLLLLPTALCVSALTALLGALFDSRRWAMLAGIAAATASYIVVTPALIVAVLNLYNAYLAGHEAALRRELCTAAEPCGSVGHPAQAVAALFSFTMFDTFLAGLGALLVAALLAWGRQQQRFYRGST